MLTAIVLAIAAVAVCAIAACMVLLDRCITLGRILDRTKALRRRAIRSRNEERALFLFREYRLQQHCAQQMRARRMVEAELAAVTQAPRFPVVTRGQA